MTPPAEAHCPTRRPRREESLHRALGLTDDEFEAVGKILGRAAQPPGAGPLRRDVERALLLQVVAAPPAAPAHRGPAGAGRPGRERRGDRRRRRHRGGHPHREPQPPLGHRALPGRGHRGGRDPARHLHHGRAAAGGDGPALLRAARRRPPALAGRGRGERHLGLRQLRRRAHRGRRADLRPLLRPEPARQRALHGRAARTSAWCSASRRARATWPCCSARAPGATASAGSACWPRPASAATTAGAADDTKRPSVQVGDPFEEKRLIEACLELLDTQAGRRDPGPRRRRPGLRHERDGRARRRRHGRRRRRGAPARGGHGALGGDDEREPGAHAGHRHPRVVAGGGGHLRQVGGAGHRHRHGHRARSRRRAVACASATAWTARCWPTCRPPRSSDDAPLYDRPRQRRRPAARAEPPTHPTTAPPTCWRCCARRAGSTASTTTSSSSTRWRGRAATPRCCGWPVPGCPAVRARRRRDDRLEPPRLRPRPPGRHRARAGRGRRQPGLRRRHAGRRRELPELRQPRAPRGDVAALGVHRRDGRGLPRPVAPGHRGQRQPLQRERRRRHRPDAGARRARARRRRARRRPPGLAWSDGRHGRPARRARRRADGSFPLEGTRWATERRDHRAGDVPAVDFAAHAAALRASSPALVAARRGRAATAPGWCTPCTTCRAAAWPSPWPRWRPRPAPGARVDAAATRPSCSPSCPPASWWPRPTPDALCAAAGAPGVPAAVLGRAGGDRFVLGGLRRPAARRRCARPTRATSPWPWANRERAACARMGDA